MTGSVPDRVRASGVHAAVPSREPAPDPASARKGTGDRPGLLRPSQVPVTGAPTAAAPLAPGRRSLRPSLVSADAVPSGAVPAAVRASRVLSSPGRPLRPDLASAMGQALGADLSAVRVHDGPDAAASARAVGAAMYTSGTHIVVGAGQPGFGTPGGRRALAHELYHVKQQSQGPVVGTRTGDGLVISHPSDPYERAAERFASQARPPAGVPGQPHAPTGLPVIPARRSAAVQRTIVHVRGVPYTKEELDKLLEDHPEHADEINKAQQDPNEEYTVTETRHSFKITAAPRPNAGFRLKKPEGYESTARRGTAQEVGAKLGLKKGLKRKAMDEHLTGEITTAEPGATVYEGAKKLAGGTGLKATGQARTHHLADSSIRTIIQWLHHNREWQDGKGAKAVAMFLNGLTGGADRPDLFKRLQKAKTPTELEGLVNELSNNAWNVGLGDAKTNTDLGAYFDESRTAGGLPTPVSSLIGYVTGVLAAHDVVPKEIIDAALGQLVNTKTGEIMHTMTATVSGSRHDPLLQTPAAPAVTVPNLGRYVASTLSDPDGIGLTRDYIRHHLQTDPDSHMLNTLMRVGGTLQGSWAILKASAAVFVTSPDGSVDIEMPET